MTPLDGITAGLGAALAVWCGARRRHAVGAFRSLYSFALAVLLFVLAGLVLPMAGVQVPITPPLMMHALMILNATFIGALTLFEHRRGGSL